MTLESTTSGSELSEDDDFLFLHPTKPNEALNEIINRSLIFCILNTCL